MSFPVSASSRYRTGVATIFDVYCEVGITDGDGLPTILTKYPDDFDDSALLRSIKQFSFPYGHINSDTVQHFNFVLTNSVGEFTFGYCRYTPQNGTCLCILSGFYWSAGFHKILKHICEVTNDSLQTDIDLLLANIYHSEIPEIGDVLDFSTEHHVLRFEVPNTSKLPSVGKDKFLRTFVQTIPIKHIIAIYACLLKERRIIFTSSALSRLSSCTCAAAALINPMNWQSVFVPVLPKQLIDTLMAPVPYLIGVPKQLLDKKDIAIFGDVVVVDLDEKTFESVHDDVSLLPEEVCNYLKKNVTRSNEAHLMQSFLHATALLFGEYRMGFVKDKSTGVVTWDREKYLIKQKPSYQHYLEVLLGSGSVQYLERFIEDRVRYVNSGQLNDDDFEKEVFNIERNRPPMKEAIDIIKETVTGFQKLARKSRNWTLRSKNAEPLSFDNIEWKDMVPSTVSIPASPKLREVAVANLIDFNSPVKNVVSPLV